MFVEKKDFLNSLLNQILKVEGAQKKQAEERYWRLVEEARKDWQEARAYFNNVTDPELIDHAIYALGAAEKRYVYLLKKAREERYFQEKLLVEGKGLFPLGEEV
ncbi:MAG: YaaL family protein [Firmicutes bacterium]|nr:YaaL family protein [Bacillota bacterium]